VKNYREERNILKDSYGELSAKKQNEIELLTRELNQV